MGESGGFFVRLITNSFALKINSYFTRESFDWHEIYILDERAIPFIELNVLDFYVSVLEVIASWFLLSKKPSPFIRLYANFFYMRTTKWQYIKLVAIAKS